MDVIVRMIKTTKPLSANSDLNQPEGRMALRTTRIAVTIRLSNRANAIIKAKIFPISAGVKSSTKEESLLKKP